MPAASHDSLWILAGLGAAWCLVFVSLLVMVFGRHKPPRFDFHWGSLGRGLGGWEVSWSLVLAVVALVLTIGTVAAAVEVISPTNKTTPEAKQGSADASKKDGAGASEGAAAGGPAKSEANPPEASAGTDAATPPTDGKSAANPAATESKGKIAPPASGGKKAH